MKNRQCITHGHRTLRSKFFLTILNDFSNFLAHSSLSMLYFKSLIITVSILPTPSFNADNEGIDLAHEKNYLTIKKRL